MAAVLYLLTAFISGYLIVKLFFPQLENAGYTTFGNRIININSWMILLPASFLLGTVGMSWISYIFAYIFRNSGNALKYGDITTFIIASLFIVIAVIRLVKSGALSPLRNEKGSFTFVEGLMLCISFILIAVLMFATFFHKDGRLYVGLSVFSDFSPHIGMIRSFSEGSNFPTGYSHFAGADIKYHFMFQFLVGNLEFLGMRIDLAMNIPSILGLMGTVSLLYVLAVKLSGKKMAGWLSVLFFMFRSSKSLFTYIAELPKGSDVIETLLLNTEYIGYTEHEDWGLWNVNVFCNQRHFGFAIPVIILALLIFLPKLYDMKNRYAAKEKKEIDRAKRFGRTRQYIESLKEALRFSLFTKEGWKIKSWKTCIATGIMLGSMAFFNGAVLIAALCVLFVLAIASDNRLEYLVAAVISVILSFAQTSFFISGTAVKSEFMYGFLADNKTFFGTIDYVIKTFGMLPLFLLIAFLVVKGVRKYILAAFSAPFIFAFTVSLTTDIAVNHKYIMLSVMLMNIFVAILITKLYENKVVLMRSVCVLMIVVMTATGLYDYTVCIKKNDPDSAFVFRDDDPITNWVKENATSKDIFLTSNYALTSLVLGGASLYCGWQYFAWSAGYNTAERDGKVRAMYEAYTPQDLDRLVKQENIRYIVVDHDNRCSQDYVLNEFNINRTYEPVFRIDENEWQTTIYDTTKPIF